MRRMLTLRRQILPGLLLLALINLINACGVEHRMIFYPSSAIESTPRQTGLEFEDIFFTTRDGVRLNGWLVPHSDASSTLIWFHGNAGNISHRVENIKLLHDLVKVNIFIFDYRGYGRSDGRPSEEGTYLDGEAAIELIRRRIGTGAEKKIVLFGRSLGAAIAAEMATRFPSQGLILESPFISIAEMARAMFPLLPIGPFLRTNYDVREKIKKLKVPLLVLHGERDEIVPFEHGKTVFDAAPEPKKFFPIPGAAHNDTYAIGGETYFRELKQFINLTGPQNASLLR